MHRHSWNLVQVVCAAGIAAFVFAGPPVTAQETDCSKCKVTDTVMDGFHVDQAVCPGADAVVCDYQFTQQTKAECEANGIVLRNCKPASRDKKYTATKFAASTCGTITSRDANGKVTGVHCGTPTGGAMEVKFSEAYCKGDPWDPTIALPIADVFNVGIDLQNGPTTLTSSLTRLGSTVIRIPSALIARALEEGLLTSADGWTRFSFTLATEGPTRFSLPDQSFLPAVVEGNAVVNSAHVRAGSLTVTLSVRTISVGAFADYAVDVAGLQVRTGPEGGPTQAEEAVSDADVINTTSRAGTLVALVQVVGEDGEEPLAGGARGIAVLGEDAPVAPLSPRRIGLQ
jgi:hypothetical protein